MTPANLERSTLESVLYTLNTYPGAKISLYIVP